jgi:nicotinamide phosphoribosyltransferase
MNPLLKTDFYKTGHWQQYPEGTEYVYSNFTPRSMKHFGKTKVQNKIVWFGLQAILKQLNDDWYVNFFSKRKDEVIDEYVQVLKDSLGLTEVETKHIEALHDLNYLPIKIKALPEGWWVNVGVPVFTITNTLPEFYWLVNFLETSLSADLWKLSTSATIAANYKEVLTEWAEKTGDANFVPLQGHDFSFRGMSSTHDAGMTGMGHLLSFMGTDTIPAIMNAKKYYNAKGPVGLSVPATEHAVMCANGKETEVETFRRLITEIYPTGIVSIVSDTWNLFDVLTKYTVELKDEILNRKPNALGLAKVVFRPDSGDPVDIICGTLFEMAVEPEEKGAIECLWDVFGGTINEKGYKVLNERVGLIYGDSITLERADEICRRLEAKGFASTNVVFGIGSYTYNYVTRDSCGFAMKATSVVVKGERRAIFKDPKTDSGTKKSAKGLLYVDDIMNGGKLIYDVSEALEAWRYNNLSTVYEDGELIFETTFNEVQANVENSL